MLSEMLTKLRNFGNTKFLTPTAQSLTRQIDIRPRSYKVYLNLTSGFHLIKIDQLRKRFNLGWSERTIPKRQVSSENQKKLPYFALQPHSSSNYSN